MGGLKRTAIYFTAALALFVMGVTTGYYYYFNSTVVFAWLPAAEGGSPHAVHVYAVEEDGGYGIYGTVYGSQLFGAKRDLGLLGKVPSKATAYEQFGQFVIDGTNLHIGDPERGGHTLRLREVDGP